MYKSIALLTTGAMLLLAASQAVTGEKGEKVSPVLKFKMEGIDGKTVDLSKYQGKVVLFVNVASRCGNTPQYKALQALHTKYAKDGLAIVGVPANNFGKQEPGTNEEIVEFCSKNYGVTFDMLAKVSVAGKDQCPLYKLLTSTETKYVSGKETKANYTGPVSWNFEKFLVSRDGTVVVRFAPGLNPGTEAFEKIIRDELEKK